MSKSKKWPEKCIWPEPLRNGTGMQWDADMVDPFTLDDEGEELLSIKDYFDSLVASGRLNDDYSWNEDYGDDSDDCVSLDDFAPETGEEFWEDGCFSLESWEDALSEHMNRLKIDDVDIHADPVIAVREITGYTFVNENLLRQAFTRRAFAVEYGLSGCGEELEFIGDSVLNLAVTKALVEPLTDVNPQNTDAPFSCCLGEGDLSKVRSHYVSKASLSAQLTLLGLDRYILYGSGEEPTESSREDALEALIGAVAIDCAWDWGTLESVIDRLICVQNTNPRKYLSKTYYEIFNAWHQKHFGRIPEYEVSGHNPYHCALRYYVPENGQGIRTTQRVDVDRESRSEARELAATLAFEFVTTNGLWVNLKDSNITPILENSINQLQELYQKKYIDAEPAYTFDESSNGSWFCSCSYNGLVGSGFATSKTKAKKAAAFQVLVRLFESAGLSTPEMIDAMFGIPNNNWLQHQDLGN